MLGDNLILTTMETIKSFTDLQQSKKLAEILPIESADMYYDRGVLPSLIDKYVTHESIKNDKYHHLIPCWSLAALLSVLPLPSLIQDKADDELFWQCSAYDEDGTLLCETYDNNAIGACYEMIIKLHEKGLL